MAIFGNGEILKNQSKLMEGYLPLEGELLKKYQSYLLQIAKDVIDVCEKEKIRYFLGGGTALGAVRHKGFIPWDDDVDINIFRSDYERFRRCFLQAYGTKYTVNDVHTPGHHFAFTSIVRNGGLMERVGGNFFSIDIFLWENAPDNKLLRGLHGFLCLACGSLLSCWETFHSWDVYIQIAKNTPSMRGLIGFKLAVGFLAHIFPLSFLRGMVWGCYGLCKNDRSKYMTVPGGKGHYFKRLLQRSQILPTVPMPFEGYHWQVARDYDAFLKTLYGADYMTPPPPEKQEHHYCARLVFPDDDDTGESICGGRK